MKYILSFLFVASVVGCGGPNNSDELKFKLPPGPLDREETSNGSQLKLVPSGAGIEAYKYSNELVFKNVKAEVIRKKTLVFQSPEAGLLSVASSYASGINCSGEEKKVHDVRVTFHRRNSETRDYDVPVQPEDNKYKGPSTMIRVNDNDDLQVTVEMVTNTNCAMVELTVFAIFHKTNRY